MELRTSWGISTETLNNTGNHLGADMAKLSSQEMSVQTVLGSVPAKMYLYKNIWWVQAKKLNI